MISRPVNIRSPLGQTIKPLDSCGNKIVQVENGSRLFAHGFSFKFVSCRSGKICQSALPLHLAPSPKVKTMIARMQDNSVSMNANFHFDKMLMLVVHQWNRFRSEFFSIQPELIRAF